MRSKFLPIFTLFLAYSQINEASAACSRFIFSGSPSTSCFENYTSDDDACSHRSEGETRCTRIEISKHTLESMIANSSNDDRLHGILSIVNEKIAHRDPNAGVVLTYTDEGAGPKPACSVYLRKGIFNTLGPVIYELVNERLCINVGMEILVDFFNVLRHRIGAIAQPYDKLLFTTYPVDEISSYYKIAQSDPAHAAFEALAQNEINVKGLPKFSVKAVPVKSGDGSEFANMIEVATAFGFSDDESAADTIWSLNYGEVLDPTRLPQGVKLTIPLVASSQSDWQGPFPIDESSEGLAMETYGEGSAVWDDREDQGSCWPLWGSSRFSCQISM
jgi:hypothetical protein